MDQLNNAEPFAAQGPACYLAGILMPIVYLSSEPYRRDRFLRFHSFQSIAFFVTGALVLVAGDLGWVPNRVSGLFALGFIAVWIVLMVTARRGRMLKLPIIGAVADHLAA